MTDGTPFCGSLHVAGCLETKETLQPRDSLASQIGTSDYNILLLGIEFHIQRTEQISIYVFCCFQFTVSKNIGEHRTGSVVSGHFMLFMGKLCLHMCVCASVCASMCEQPRYMRCLGRDAEHTHTCVRGRIKNANLLSIYINFKFCLSTRRHKKYLYLYLYTCVCVVCIHLFVCAALQVLAA